MNFMSGPKLAKPPPLSPTTNTKETFENQSILNKKIKKN